MSKRLSGTILITFPTERFKLPLQLVQQHRAEHFRRMCPDQNWWREPTAVQLESWLCRNMKWSQLGHHVEPNPGNRRNKLCNRWWREGEYTIQTKLND